MSASRSPLADGRSSRLQLLRPIYRHAGIGGFPPGDCAAVTPIVRPRRFGDRSPNIVKVVNIAPMWPGRHRSRDIREGSITPLRTGPAVGLRAAGIRRSNI